MPLFEIEDSNRKKETSSHGDFRRARLLLEAVRKHTFRSRPVRLTMWAHHFTMLRKVDGTPGKRIDTVLNWYVQHIGKEYIPHAFSAESFRKKFDSIESIMRLRAKRDVPISDAAVEIQTTLKSQFPRLRSTNEQLLAAIQRSLDTHTRLVDTLSTYLAAACFKPAKATPLFRVAAHVKEKLGNRRHFVTQWMCRVLRGVSNWADFSGNLESQAFVEGSKRYTAWGEEITSAYCGSRTRWAALLKELADED